MEPTLIDGQGLIALRSGRARLGQLRCVEHPMRRGFWLVKRVASIDGETMTVSSDNRSVDTVDSTRFGGVPIVGSYRVVLRIPSRLM